MGGGLKATDSISISTKSSARLPWQLGKHWSDVSNSFYLFYPVYLGCRDRVTWGALSSSRGKLPCQHWKPSIKQRIKAHPSAYSIKNQLFLSYNNGKCLPSRMLLLQSRRQDKTNLYLIFSSEIIYIYIYIACKWSAFCRNKLNYYFVRVNAKGK